MSYLVIAYLIILASIFGYVLYLTARANRLLREIDSLKARIGSSNAGSGVSDPPGRS